MDLCVISYTGCCILLNMQRVHVWRARVYQNSIMQVLDAAFSRYRAAIDTGRNNVKVCCMCWHVQLVCMPVVDSLTAAARSPAAPVAAVLHLYSQLMINATQAAVQSGCFQATSGHCSLAVQQSHGMCKTRYSSCCTCRCM
jgi:hypothetical protein